MKKTHANIVCFFSQVKKLQALVFAILLLLQSSALFSQNEKDSLKMENLLSLSFEDLMNVEVTTAGKTSQKISDIPASVVIISRDEIEKHGYQTIEEILQNVPGLYGINDYGEGGMIFGVRGFWSGIPNDNIIILINNIPQTKSAFSNHPLAEIPVPVGAIDRIEVVRGPMSIIYGSGAFFGAINIITNSIEDSDHENALSASLGSSKTGSGFLSVSKQTKKLKLSTNVSVYQTDGIDQPASGLMSDPSILTNYGLSPEYTTGGSMGSNYKYLDFSANISEFYFNFVLVEAITGSQFSFPAFGDGNKKNDYDYNLAIGYRKAFSNKFTLDTKITYNKERSLSVYSFFHEDFYGIQQIEGKGINFTSDIFYSPLQNLYIQAGIYVNSIYDVYNLYDLPSFGDPFFNNNYVRLDDKGHITSHALYTQLDYRPLEKLQIVAGLRLEKSLEYKIFGNFSYETESFNKIVGVIDRNNIDIIPRLAGIYSLNNSNIIKLLYGKAVNKPSFFQDYIQVQSKEQNLLPEEIETVEINYQSIISADYLVSLNLFHNVMDNLITRSIILDNTGNYDYSFFNNAGRMISNGIELSFSAKPVDKLFLELSGTYQNTEDMREGYENIEVAYSPKFLGYFKLRYNVSDDFTMAINGQYVGAMETLWEEAPDDTQMEYVATGRIGDQVKGYTLLGLNLRYENLFTKGLFLNARVSNLLNSEIRYPTFTNNAWANKGTLGYGRGFLMTIGWKF